MRNFSPQKNLPGTSAPPPAFYTPIYERILDAGDSAQVITPSAKVSGTFRSATVAADEFKTDRIQIINTNTIAGNLGTLVLQAKEWVDQGLDITELSDRIREMTSREHTFFLVPTLEYLHKGGRIGGATKLVGTLLQIVPILTLQDGQVEVYDKARSLKQAITHLVDLTVSLCENNSDAHLSVGQIDSPELSTKIATRLQEHLDIDSFPNFVAPPAIVVHTGPGLVVISCFSKPE